MRKAILAAAVVAITALGASPAFAVMCYGAGNGGGADVSFGFGIEFGHITEDDENEWNLIRLRRAGVDATRVETWNGCLRAFVRNGSGSGEHMEFYHPRTLEQVF